ncbi:acyclic terpene utilization AtuA family protein [Nocardioides sp.]|uniref:acyclic terpene utilization AtuA family protein n=1 Tax=Nocardioides sp. TaxID=35761 RepID=UPI00262DE628|nr:acyclic terpene utilization AtuA family protein [Nocardioides sp.]
MSTTAPLKIANVSGFYGDRLSAMREQLDGGPVDVITGDWLAELTMLILGKDTLKDPSLGYAKTFLTQLRECLTLAMEKGVKIVSNAGGLNPAGLAAAITALAQESGVECRVAYVDGDDLRESGLFPGALTANAYLGAFGVAEALRAGADVVVTGRVTDASIVMGPAIWHHGWTRDHLDELAGAVIAGHVIECGTQACGGNFAGLFDAIRADRLTDPEKPFGFPIAEIAADGSCVITKHPGTGGLVTEDTVSAQLFYEIQGATYLNPDVSTDLTSLRVAEVGHDRVEISGVRGDLPPRDLKVAVNEIGGWRNSVEFVLTGLDIEPKAELLRAQVEAVLPAGLRHSWSPFRVPAPDSATEEGAAVLLRLTAWSSDADEVGKAFTGPAIELVLASFAGFHVTAPPGRPSAYGVYRPAYVDREHATETVHLPDGTVVSIDHPTAFSTASATTTPDLAPPAEPFSLLAEDTDDTAGAPDAAPSARRMELGRAVYARSGDKGGNANIGLWIPAGRPEAGVAWLLATVTPAWVRRLLPETAGLEIDVVPLPNLRGVNVVIHDILGAGVAEGVRFDPQAKALGEWIRSRTVEIPDAVLGEKRR